MKIRFNKLGYPTPHESFRDIESVYTVVGGCIVLVDVRQTGWKYDVATDKTTFEAEVLTEFTPLVDLAREVLGEEHTVR